MVKNLPAKQERHVQFLGREDSLEKEMATLSGILAWGIPWTEEPGRLQFMGLQNSWTWLRAYTTTKVEAILMFFSLYSPGKQEVMVQQCSRVQFFNLCKCWDIVLKEAGTRFKILVSRYWFHGIEMQLRGISVASWSHIPDLRIVCVCAQLSLFKPKCPRASSLFTTFLILG